MFINVPVASFVQEFVLAYAIIPVTHKTELF